jgi:phosphomannomutase
MPLLLDRLGCEVTAINMQPDGPLPAARPSPWPTTSASSRRSTREAGADVGFAVDPDVDRLALVDERGRRGHTLALAAKLVLRHRRAPWCTNLVDQPRGRRRGDLGERAVIRAAVGEGTLALRMRAERAAVGGEGNGGVILPELHSARDAPLGAALSSSCLLEENRRCRPWSMTPRAYVIVKDSSTAPTRRSTRVRGAVADVSRRRARQPGRARSRGPTCVHVRPSGTERSSA